MRIRKDLSAVVTIILIFLCTVPAILSIDFSHSYNFENQYGDMIKIYGYGIYKWDSYFKVPILIGSDICATFFILPLFIYFYLKERNSLEKLDKLKLISIYSVILYYSASLSFGVTYNYLFLAYVGLFTVSLFSTFFNKRNRVGKNYKAYKAFKCVFDI